MYMSVLLTCIYAYHTCMYIYIYIYMPCACGGQNRVLDSLQLDGCEPSGGFWETNLGLPKEQEVFLIAESSLQTQMAFF